MRTILSVLLLTLWIPASALAQEVGRAQLTSAIEDKEPVDDLGQQVTGNSDTLNQLMFFTHITNGKGATIEHRWLFEDKELARVSLPVGSDSWRTYSSKRLLPLWQGDWRVEVLLDGELIYQHPFTLYFNN